MSRQIEFRGKRVDNGEWVYGDLSSMAQRVYISNFQPDNTYKDGAENTHLYKHLWVIPETVGQFTGLTDKNGKKIFEGDIVKATICINDWSRDKVRNEERIYEIKYHTKHCYFYLAKEGNNLLFDGNWSYYLKEIKVIGNIHDNKELLGENKWWNT